MTKPIEKIHYYVQRALAEEEPMIYAFWCSPIEDQGHPGFCTANDGVGLIEYYQRR